MVALTAVSQQIVPRASAVIGLPGDVENAVKLDADHSNMCCFDLSNQKDRDNFHLVEANMKDPYDLAIARGELMSLSETPSTADAELERRFLALRR